MSRALRLVVVLVVAAGAVAVASALVGDDDAAPRRDRPPPVALPAGPDFLGMIDEQLVALPRARVEAELALASRLRLGLLRQTFDWSTIERTPGRYDFARYDALMEVVAEHGWRMLPVLFGPPPFHSSRPASGARRGTYPPKRPADMAAFAAAAVRRYGPDGSFWRERPELRRIPIRDWQVWNEPSLPVFWASGPDPREYTALLAATARAIRGEDAGASVVSAGLPQTRAGVPFGRYARGLYRAGARRWFDVMAIHPYAHDVAGVIAAVRRARQLMDAQGARSALWNTEMGWASGGPPSDFTVGERGQADRIRAALPALARRRRELRLRGIVYFAFRDAVPYPGGRDFWGLHTGLLPLAGRPKPAFDAFRAGAFRVAELTDR